jgi:hypothetical protein
MDSSDLKWFALVAVIGLVLYVAFFRSDFNSTPAVQGPDSSAVPSAPAGIPGGM